MLKKRIVGVITVKDGIAVQSFGYNRYLPLGKPEILAENLDRWGADEIFLQCIDRSCKNLGPDFSLLESIGRKGLGTPLIYAGGIRTVDEGIRAIQLGADRICIDALLHNTKVVYGLSGQLGAQALIAALPLSIDKDSINWLDYLSKRSGPIKQDTLHLLREKVISEALIIDWKNEGYAGRFDFRLLTYFPLTDIPIIAFGGLSDANMLCQVLEHPQVVAAAIGNFLNYREHAILYIKDQLAGLPLRMPDPRPAVR